MSEWIMPAIFSLFVNSPEVLQLCFTPVGSWICILICGLILFSSRARFEKVFNHRIWLIGLSFIVGMYILIFFITSIAFTVRTFACNGGEVVEGEATLGLLVFQVFLGQPVFYFTVAYLLSFLFRLLKSKKRQKGGEEPSC